jgi:hypothetical protein
MAKEAVPRLTGEELYSTMVAAAGEAAIPREPSAAGVVEFEDAVVDSPILRLVRAVDETLPHSSRKQKAVRQRVLLAWQVLLDPRAAPYLQSAHPDARKIDPSFLEAIATVPLLYGEPCPFERIRHLAEKIRRRLEQEHPPRAPHG